MSFYNNKQSSLYLISGDDSSEEDSDDDDLLLNLGPPKPMVSSSIRTFQDEEDDSGGGWSSSDDSTSHSEVELEETDIDSPSLVAKGRLATVHKKTDYKKGIKDKGGEENIRIALNEMDRICTFDPLIVLRGDHDSIMADHRGKMAKYLIAIRERINDLAQSIKS